MEYRSKLNNLGTYYIKDLESITGIKAHTIRIWEQRYNLVVPKRTSTNIRYYDDEDVKLFLNVALLNKKGIKISKIATFSRSELHAEALITTEKSSENDDLIHSLILATYNLNEEAINLVFSNYIMKKGFEKTILELGFPFLNRLGELWVSNALHPALEHFASNIIRKKIEIAIEGKTAKKDGYKKFILFLPPDEMHELSLLFASYMISSAGHETLYFGQNTPISDFNAILEVYKPDYLVSIFTNCKAQIDAIKFVNDTNKHFPEIKMLLSGGQILNNKDKFLENIILKNNVQILTRPEELGKYLEDL